MSTGWNVWRGASLLVVVGVAACTSTPNRAPVEDRGATTRSVPGPGLPMANGPESSVDAPKPLPGWENAGKPGYYSVKPGDTLIRIGLENGQNWRDLVRWNNLDNPNLIEVGQVLRVVAPGADPSVVATRPVTVARAEPRPLDAKPSASAVSALAVVVPPTASPPVAAAVPAPKDGDDDIVWAWPTKGSVMTAFDDAKGKGLDFGGKAGDPVLAAADGRVVYAGSNLRGYGNLIILKHNNTYLTAYAHNQTLLVKDEQSVRRGQKIAEMGATDAESVRLHFEIRRLGKPVDPARLLPAR